MYNSIHKIPAFEYYMCSFGNLSHLGRGFFKKRRFEKLRKQLGHEIKPEAIVIDLAEKANWLDTMKVFAQAAQQAVFADEDQKERLLDVIGRLGIGLDLEKNIKRIERFQSQVEETAKAVPKQQAKNDINIIYSQALYINMMLDKDINVHTISIAEFVYYSKQSEKKQAITDAKQ